MQGGVIPKRREAQATQSGGRVQRGSVLQHGVFQQVEKWVGLSQRVGQHLAVDRHAGAHVGEAVGGARPESNSSASLAHRSPS